MATLSDRQPEVPYMHHARIRLRRVVAATAAALAMASIPLAASAHVELVSSSPDPGANLQAAPTRVTLTFDGELEPTRSGFTVSDHHGEEVGSGGVDLEVADRNVMTGPLSISEPGVYTIEWSALGVDGHMISGSFSFGYASDEEIPGAAPSNGHDSPDTALPRARPDTLTVAGLLLVALAGLAAVRRSMVR
jgi:methionine-rich copper-binding protein CopC